MPRILIALFFCLSMISIFSTTAQAEDQMDISRHRECSECGMDRKAYGFSRMLVILADGKEVGVCSLHCAVLVMDSNKAETVKALLVADRNSHDLVPAEKAFWVLGGKKRGVMTMRAKWAFTSKEAAQDFVKEYGGEIVTWDAALAAAKTDAMPKAR
ncbi:MAG: nitrous oxide reductase accessory protein NosL [Desulfuromonadales bacterium]|nr:nitrous oxide reductase accessory protein NosL [Desulfuromonadales bacterium]